MTPVSCFIVLLSEESELWPLFAEHFTVEEQQYLVRCIAVQYSSVCAVLYCVC